MRKVIVGARVTMDGVMQAPSGPEPEDKGFEFGGWAAALQGDDPVVWQELGKLFPVLLGGGKRLFSDDAQPRAFKLTESAVSPNGIIHATYLLDGNVKTGTVGDPQEVSAAKARRVKPHG